MHLNIPEKWEPFIRAKLQSGEYDSPDALLEEALALLQQRDTEQDDEEYDPLGIEELLLEGLNSGPATPMTTEDWDAIEREGKRRIAERKTLKNQ